MSAQKPLQVDIITVFPEMVEPYLQGSILGRAQKAKLLQAKAHQLRAWTDDVHQTVDDRPFGGGPGMLMKIEPIHRALMDLRVCKANGERYASAKNTRVIVTSAKGKLFAQEDAMRLSSYDRLVFICGRYEGIDERVAEHLADEELCVGEYVLTGGELPALIMTDAAIRLRKGVLGRDASLDTESHSVRGELEYPQYTRPEHYEPAKGVSWGVPDMLLSGHHKNIEAWRHSKKGRM